MLFNSGQFVVFLPIVLFIYYSLSHKNQNTFLLAASCFFYACWDWRFLAPLLFSTSIDYFCAYRMQDLHEAGEPEEKRKAYLALSVATNIGLLGFFKYFNFFAGSMLGLLRHFGLHASLWSLNVILPVGISFYTFQALSYTIDVYRGQMHPTRNFRDFLLAVLYFPHLVAGPIQRAHSLLPQVIHPRQITAERIANGLHLIFWGYFKKVFIADNLAPIVSQIYASNHPSGFHVLMGAYAFAFQIYCDFSGYTDIARGIAKLMGFEFVLNFNLPYFALNPADFWRRWHISLSTWLRDYLYIPLGGNRSPESWKTHRNLMLTMVLGGLWHGAGWGFVLWGFYQGSLLILHRVLSPFLPSVSEDNSVGHTAAMLVKIAIMFQFTCFGWLLFRAKTFEQIAGMTVALLNPLQGYDPAMAVKVVLLICPLLIVQIVQHASKDLNFLNFAFIGPEGRAVIYGVITYCVLFLGGRPQAFIYFQF